MMDEEIKHAKAQSKLPGQQIDIPLHMMETKEKEKMNNKKMDICLSLLMKKNNKSHLKQFVIPSDSYLGTVSFQRKIEASIEKDVIKKKTTELSEIVEIENHIIKQSTFK